MSPFGAKQTFTRGVDPGEQIGTSRTISVVASVACATALRSLPRKLLRILPTACDRSLCARHQPPSCSLTGGRTSTSKTLRPCSVSTTDPPGGGRPNYGPACCGPLPGAPATVQSVSVAAQNSKTRSDTVRWTTIVSGFGGLRVGILWGNTAPFASKQNGCGIVPLIWGRRRKSPCKAMAT